MKLDKFNHNYSCKWALFLFSWLALDILSPSLAQIVPDQTLNHENSVILPQQGFDKIDGGALRGANLFHSFQEFNINLGRSIYFSNPDSVTNILTRVTGNNPSNILGTLGVLGQANFYLINPHGIIFGNNARLDIQGSFTATTTPAIRIGDQLFSAINPDTSALLNIQPEVLFSNSLSHLGNITNNGNLSVNQGQNIIFIGNTITQNGLLKAPAGEIQLIGDKIVLTSLSQTDTSSPNFGGQILLGGDQQGTGNFSLASTLEIAPNALINASATDDGDGGRVIAWSNQLTRFYGSIFAQGGEHGGNGGFVEVSGKNNLIFQGNVNTLAPFGTTGTLLIDPTDIVIESGSGSSGFTGEILANAVIPTAIYESEIETLSGSTQIILQATGNITINPLSDGVLTFSNQQDMFVHNFYDPITGAIGSYVTVLPLEAITFIADSDHNGIGDFSMKNTDSINTQGRSIAIEGANLNLGLINSSSDTKGGGNIQLTTTKGNISTGSIDSHGYNQGGSIRLIATQGNISAGLINSSATNPNIYDSNFGNFFDTQGGDITLKAINGLVQTDSLIANASMTGGNITVEATNITTGFIDTHGLGLLKDGGFIHLKAVEGSILTEDILTAGLNNSTAISHIVLESTQGNVTIGKVISGTYFTAGVIDIKAINGCITTGDLYIKGGFSRQGRVNLEGENIRTGVIETSGELGGLMNLTASNGLITTGSLYSGGYLRSGNITLTADTIHLENISISVIGRYNVGSVELKGNDIQLKNVQVFANSFAVNENAYSNTGNISIKGNSILLESSQLSNQNTTQSEGGKINISGNDLTLNHSLLISSSTGKGSAGNINLDIKNNISMSYSQVLSDTKTQGNAGTIAISTPELNLTQTFLNTGTKIGSSGNGGNILLTNINTLNLLDYSAIQANTEGTGNAGQITINSDTMTMNNLASVSSSALGNSGNTGEISLIRPNQINIDNSIISTTVMPTGNGRGGNITITTDTLNLTNLGTILAITDGIGNTGNLFLNITQNLLLNTGIISSKVEANAIGNSGITTINAPTITLENESIIEASTAGIGNAGEIIITSPNQLTINNSNISTAVEKTGDGIGGNITITTDTLNLNNLGTILASTAGIGNTGNVLLNINQNLLLNRGIINSKVEQNAQGDSGIITINSPTIILENDSLIEASTAGIGNAGEIIITNPNQLTINNSIISTAVNPTGIGTGGLINISTNILNLLNQGTIEASTYGQGDANSIIVQTNQLIANNGSQLQTITDSQYNAGNINLTINDSLQLIGENTGLFASTSPNSAGKGGNILVTAEGNILLQDSASIAVNSKGLGQGGDIDLTANKLTLYNRGIINAETASNQGGSINLNLTDLLIMRYGSKITATAGTTGAGGDGGNIKIKANFIVGIPGEDSDITANAFEGNGGQINITTNGIFGLQFRPKLTPLSDITASSQFGVSGTVSILTPNVNPASGLTELPSNLVDASQLIGQNACSFEGGKIAGGSSFTVTGKGGLPPSPTESLTLVSGVVNWSNIGDSLAKNKADNLVASQDLSNLILAENDLEKQALSAYQSRNYQQSINLLITLKTQEINPFKLAEINRNLALNYQQLGDWTNSNQFLQESLNQLNSLPDSPEKQDLLAEILDVQGQEELMTGESQKALETWQKVSQLYQNSNNTTGLISSEINQILALKAMGFYTQASYQINQLLVKNNDLTSNNQLKVKLLTLQGEMARLTGQYQLSQDYLQEALKSSNESNQDEVLLSLGNTAWFNQKPDESLNYYQQVEKSSPSESTQLQAKLNQFNLLIQQNKTDLAIQLLPSIQEMLSHVPSNRNKIYGLLNIANNLEKISQLSSSLSYLKTALSEAKIINDTRSQSYSLGFLGHIYEQQKEYNSAKLYTQNALILAENLQANDLTYQWQWQMGRINKQLGDFNEAITAYQQSLINLKSIRADLVAISSNVQFSFREQVEPIYRQLVDLLLQPNATQEQLISARQVIESLQLAELDNFFRDACLKTTSVQIDQIDPTASIIYTIVLEDRIEVIATLPNQPLVHYSASIPSNQLESMVNNIRNSLTNGRRPLKADNSLQQLQLLYDGLIRPLEGRLQENNIKTLVFINDGVLRNIPFSALYDGEHYLIEKYAVALAPSLQLLEPKSLTTGKLQILTAGLTEARQGFSALPGVGEELQEIQEEAQTEILLNQSFTPSNLEESFKKSPYTIIHLATHGQFSSNADNTFLLTWDEKLNISQLNQLLRQDNRSIDLLVLSACKTATGDSRATLGLAGMAVRAGAKSTLASLWSVSDIATSLLMSRFYQFLATGQYTKAEAFRQAQLQVLQDSRFAHPYYWSAFVLLGNWL